MAEFKKLGEVDLIDTATDSANVLVEESGKIKRVPKSQVGGSGGKMLDITYDMDEGTYSTNMGYSEFEQEFISGNIIGARLVTVKSPYGTVKVYFCEVISYQGTYFGITFAGTSVKYRFDLNGVMEAVG